MLRSNDPWQTVSLALALAFASMLGALSVQPVKAMGPAQSHSQPQDSERRIAMVIGNGAYEHAPRLTNPANDARDISAQLRRAGFEVFEAIDLSKLNLERKLREYARAIENADVALLFYAGHGLQVSGRNYLLPVDAKLASERDLDFEAIRLEFILSQMELGRDGKTTLVFLDACRDNPLAKNLARSMGTRSAALGRGLAQVKSGVGTFISFSTQPGNVAVDGKGRNSPFTAALKKHIPTAGVSLNGLMIRVRRAVIKATNGRQVPWDHSALTGEFFFHPASAPGAARTAMPKIPQGTAPPTPSKELAALQRKIQELEKAMKKNASSASSAVASRKANLEYRIKALERRQADDRQKIFEFNRQAMGATARERLTIARNRHKLSVAMIQRASEIKRLREELAELTGTPKQAAAKPARAEASRPAQKAGCTKLAPNASAPLKLEIGTLLCSGRDGETAKVLRIAERAVAFSVNGSQEFTCRAGETCQFNWRRAPYFTIRAQADPALGIKPQGQLIPR